MLGPTLLPPLPSVKQETGCPGAAFENPGWPPVVVPRRTEGGGSKNGMPFLRKLTIGILASTVVYAPSTPARSGLKYEQLTGFLIYVTASESARGRHVGRQTECAQAL
jgi:hypothetical protein